METLDLLFYGSLAGAILMAFSLGGNDAANSMASAVGAKAITMRQAIFIAGSMNFVGATFLGAAVTSTVAKGIVDPSQIPDTTQFAIGMFAALLAAGIFVLAATLLGLPVSSSHAIVGAVAGFGVAAAGWDVVEWSVIGVIVVAWVLTPFVAGGIAFVLSLIVRGSFFRGGGDRSRRIVEVMPLWMALVAALVLLFFGEEVFVDYDLPLGEVGALMLVGALVVYILGYRMIIDQHFVQQREPEAAVQEGFRRLQIFTSGYISLAHGANDVANAFGPVLAILLLAHQGFIPDDATVPMWVLIVGGAGIAAGIGMVGRRVIETIADDITQLDNIRGFSADFTIASTVMGASQMGLPVSTSHAAVGAIAGTAFAAGEGLPNMKVLAKIFMAWVLTVPIAGLVSALLYWIFMAIFMS